MYFLGDLEVLAELVHQASHSMPDTNPTPPEDNDSDEDTPDSGPSQPNNQEE